MGRIHVLDVDVSNKIAAGEVVERPASVIKELVENSIDAHADMISVEIKNGGVSYMRVSDNGSGMDAEDAKICFLRHATSKVREAADLKAISTLGFRGEALSSIGAVAKVSLYTKTKDASAGICVTCEGGEILSSEDAGIPDGTTTVVENLFYNTPARLKFLKKNATESGYITDIMTRLIFAHTEISFRLVSDGKEKLFSPGDSNLKNAVYTAYGKDYARDIIDVDYEADSVKISGVIGKGSASRPNRNYENFFVNGRYIKSPIMMRALEEAYKNQIMIGKFPMCVLNITIDPEDVDINVHPTKLEVKFADERFMYQAVYSAAKKALYDIPDVPEIRRTEEKKQNETDGKYLSDLVKNMPHEADVRDYGKNTSYSGGGKPYTGGYNGKKSVSGGIAGAEQSGKEDMYVPEKTVKISDAAAETEKAEIGGADKSEEIAAETPAAPEPTEPQDNIFTDEYFDIVGQVFDTYIIAQKNDKMLLIDQHAAHERLKYEELKKDMENKTIMSQMLIEPAIINLREDDFAVFCENKEIFAETGFECDEFGEDAIIIRSAPCDVEAGDVEQLAEELIFNIKNLKKQLISEKKECIIYSVACKSAIKANNKLTVGEMESLVRRVLQLKNINTCPHGRPIIITMSKKELEKEFKRIV